MTRGREFPHSNRAGRNASEPMSSLVNKAGEADPVVRRGRPLEGAGRTEVAFLDSRGSRVGMFSQMGCPVLEIQPRGRGDRRPARIRQRKRHCLSRKSEGFKVPFEVMGQQNPGRGKGPYFVRATNKRRIRGLQLC